MASPRICILRAPGTNCDIETAHAFELAGAKAERVHLFRVLETPELLREYQGLCIPGGFSYGDDLGAGVIFSGQLRGQLNEMMQEFVQADTLVLGICNGFQVLLKSGLLLQSPAGAGQADEPSMTLTWNSNARYTDRWVRLKVASESCVFLKDMDEFESPVAHAEGRLAVGDPGVIDKLRQQDSIALCYWSDAADQQSKETGSVTDLDVLPEPENPNGSIANIAALSNATGRILGLMPHPERYLFATQHPQWTRNGFRGEGDGLQLFRNAVNYFK
ncbi:MAG: phosphoribosylformylglycinamidine synthase subunit PurQ [Fuerstiella sp.]|nr:phosphoribosylformylglycinamidine synthase subunit PurQ [Fuerstiella sp.]